MKFHPMPVLTILTAISLAILIWLGNWQYGRYSEKMDANVQIQTQVAPEAISVVVETSNAGLAQNLYGAMDGEPTWRRYVPGRLDGTGELVLVLWDATGGPQPVPLAVSEATGPYSRVANVLDRPLKKGAFAAASDPGNNVWHVMDTAGMAAQLGYADEPLRVVETIDITVRNSADMSKARRTINPYAYAQVLDPLPPERHFGYALTWWGMAIGLIAVYLALHHSRGRLRFRS